MLRIHFGGEDLVRTRVVDAPDPLWEVVLSLKLLRARHGGETCAAWRRRARHELERAGLVEMVRERLFPLTRGDCYRPDFLTPPEGLLGLEAGVEAILSTPRGRIRQEMRRLDLRADATSWVSRLADGDHGALTDLGRHLVAYHRTVLGPLWPQITAAAEADHAHRGRDRRAGGIDRVLIGFSPMLRWRPPVLEIDHREDRDLHLAGRGLLLIPSYFCRHRPVPLTDPELAPVLVFPVRRPPAVRRAGTGSDLALARLVGTVRAQILRLTHTGCTTTELARRADVSVPTASQHAAVLRNAGLIVSHRNANSVVHLPTPLGRALIEQSATATAMPRALEISREGPR